MAWKKGRYLLTGSQGSRTFSFILRVDLESNLVPEGFVSADVYLGKIDLGNDADALVASQAVSFLSSFCTDRPQQWNDGSDYVAVLLRLSQPAQRIALTLHNSAVAPFRATWTAAGSSGDGNFPTADVALSGVFLADTLHSLYLDVHRAPSVPDVFAVTASWNGSSFKVADVFRKAGITAVAAISAKDAPDRTAWSLPQLKAAAGIDAGGAVIGLPRSIPRFAASVLMVSRLQSNPTATGLMFDQHHRSAAVFYDCIKGAFLPTGQHAVDSNYLFTFVHEVAHCLNLPHAFEPKRLGDYPSSQPFLKGLDSARPTFTNYAQNYTGPVAPGTLPPFSAPAGWGSGDRDRYEKFWRRFEYSFDARELFELAHGDRRNRISGDGPQGAVNDYRGDFNTNLIPADHGPRDVVLSLRLRRDPFLPNRHRRLPHLANLFEFGEPIHVEAELRSLAERELHFDRKLSLVTGDLELAYEKPGGESLCFHSPCYITQLPETKTLSTNEALGLPTAFYKDCALSFGAHALPFLEPGRYRLRASYRHGDEVLLSNILNIYVRYPTPKVENIVVPLLDDDVAEFFAFRGVDGLPRADGILAEVFGDAPKIPKPSAHPLHWYYLAYRARILAERSVQRDPKTSRAARGSARPDDALRWYQAAFGLRSLQALKKRPRTPLRGLPFSNIHYLKIGIEFYKVLRTLGKQDSANALQLRLNAGLKERGVPGPIRKRLKSRFVMDDS